MTDSAAFFDVDGTLVDKNIVHHFFYIRRRMLREPLRLLWTSLFLSKVPYYMLLDKLSRTKLNVVFYRNYAGLESRRVRELVASCFRDVIQPHIFREAYDVVAEHRQAGRRIVFVTGSVDFIVEPLAVHFQTDALVAPRLIERGGRFTGELDGPPVGQDEKARRIRAYADAQGIDLAGSYAYGDSIADLPMLESVGRPHAVNPDKSLARTARRLGWPALNWSVPNARSNGR